MAAKTAGPTVITKKQYDDLIEEINNISAQLTKTRESLWGCQDKLKESQKKTSILEGHISELVAQREADEKMIANLRKENSKTLEEEAKMRESLDLMKKVFTKSQLRAKADQETLKKLKEERDTLKAKNSKLLEENVMAKNDQYFLMEANKKAQENEKNLNLILRKTRQDLAQYQNKQGHADTAIKQLTKRLVSMHGGDESISMTKLNKQRKMINSLERQVQQLAVQEEREESSFMKRALFDEDLDDGITRQFMQSMDCTAYHDEMIPKVLDCASFNDSVAVSNYPFSSKAQTSM